jgi:hypothetical protein
LLLVGQFSLRRLFLEGAERANLAFGGDDLFHGGGAGGADQLILEVGDADVETEPLHVHPGEVRAEAGPLESVPEVALLALVAETRQPEVETARAEPLEEASDRLRTAHRDDGDAVRGEIPAAALGQRFERELVADPFDEDDGVRLAVECLHERHCDGATRRALRRCERMRTLIAVVLTILVLAPLAAWAVRGVRRATGAPAEGPRSTLQLFLEGLIVLGAFVLGVLVIVAFLAVGDE